MLSEFLARLDEVHTMAEYSRLFERTLKADGAQPIRANSSFFQGVIVSFSGRHTGRALTENLKNAAACGISAAPSILKVAELDDDAIIHVLQCAGCSSGAPLTPYEWGNAMNYEMEARASVARKVVDQFTHMAQLLAQAGYRHEEAMSNAHIWLITPDRHDLLIPDWGTLRPIRRATRDGLHRDALSTIRMFLTLMRVPI